MHVDPVGDLAPTRNLARKKRLDYYSFGKYFERSKMGDFVLWVLPGDIFTSTTEEKAWKAFQRAGAEAYRALNALLRHVRQNYLEVDPRQTSVTARSALREKREREEEKVVKSRRRSKGAKR
ncbi:MAG: hypothetical protein ACRELW_18375 [Candidatus Rokuibacteriota bacterium]